MSIESSMVEQVARLARLAVEPGETAGYLADLGAILALVEHMNTAATDGVKPLAHPLEIAARMRPDVVTEVDQRELFQSQAPQVERGHYLVPKVIE